MLTYVVRRLAFVPLSLFIVICATFVILRLTGNPIDIFLDVNRTPEQVAALTARLHLDEPLPIQFLIYLRDLIGGDFGASLQFGGSAMAAVQVRFGATIQLVVVALSLAV